MSKRDYYEILGVEKNADQTVIKKAYRKIALKFHPDRNPDDKAAEDKFKEAAEAYEVLSDEQKRARYDRYGHAGMGGQGGFSGGGHGMTMEDIFEQFGDVFGGGGGSPFDTFFGGSRGGGRRSSGRGEQGSDIRIKVALTLEEMANGVNKKIKIKKNVTCGTCAGSGAKSASATKTCETCQGGGYVRQVKNTFLGAMQTTTTCPSCQGTGSTITEKCGTCRGDGRTKGDDTVEFDIPPGVEDGIQLSVRGKGNAGRRKGPSGDLLVVIEQKEGSPLKRDGINLLYDLYINFVDATLGTHVEVPTLNGRVKIKIPAGTQSGKIFRLKGKGMPSLQSYQKGDQLIYVNVWTPKQVNKEEEALLEKLRDMPNMNPSPESSEKGFFEKMKEYFSG